MGEILGAQFWTCGCLQVEMLNRQLAFGVWRSVLETNLNVVSMQMVFKAGRQGEVPKESLERRNQEGSSEVFQCLEVWETGGPARD